MTVLALPSGFPVSASFFLLVEGGRIRIAHRHQVPYIKVPYAGTSSFRTLDVRATIGAAVRRRRRRRRPPSLPSLACLGALLRAVVKHTSHILAPGQRKKLPA